MVDEESEFTNLVSHTLERKGILSKMRAQLRASIFLALEDEAKLNGLQSLKGQELEAFLNSADGRCAFGLVKDLLEYFGLEHSLAVLTQEAGLNCHKLQVTGKARPLLLEIIAKRDEKPEATAGQK